MSYKTGYRRPPKSGQFKKGQSGNPKGRPKGSKGFLTILEEELSKKVTVNENGKKKTVTRMQAMVKRLVSDALQGERKSLMTLVEVMRRTGQMEETDIQSLIPDNYEDILNSYVEEQKDTKQKALIKNNVKENES